MFLAFSFEFRLLMAPMSLFDELALHLFFALLPLVVQFLIVFEDPLILGVLSSGLRFEVVLLHSLVLLLDLLVLDFAELLLLLLLPEL